jgi:hypothetical protein
MPEPFIQFDAVLKKFRRDERHDTLGGQLTLTTGEPRVTMRLG